MTKTKTPLDACVDRVHARNPKLSRRFIRQVAVAMGPEAYDSDILDACEQHCEEMAELG